MQQAGPTPSCGGQKFRSVILEARSPSPTPGPPAQSSSAREISPYNYWLQNPAGVELEEVNARASRSST